VDKNCSLPLVLQDTGTTFCAHFVAQLTYLIQQKKLRFSLVLAGSLPYIGFLRKAQAVLRRVPVPDRP
jgi:hypothetical protein